MKRIMLFAVGLVIAITSALIVGFVTQTKVCDQQFPYIVNPPYN